MLKTMGEIEVQETGEHGEYVAEELEAEEDVIPQACPIYSMHA